ncbi:kinase-like domain-containing protein [Zopfochytrium polystomum]|nr:kinase-like domain-containing protein [Zopfochytrium polystomum]
MAFLHGCTPAVVHQDLKSLNLLVAADWTCKVADFGIAATVAKRRRRVAAFLGGRRSNIDDRESEDRDGDGDEWVDPDGDDTNSPAHGGTLQWMAPELMYDGPVPEPSTKADVFAFGVILWEVATRKKPWIEIDLADVAPTVRAGGRLPVRANWPRDFTRLVEDCWAQDPKRRPDFKNASSDCGQ